MLNETAYEWFCLQIFFSYFFSIWSMFDYASKMQAINERLIPFQQNLLRIYQLFPIVWLAIIVFV